MNSAWLDKNNILEHAVKLRIMITSLSCHSANIESIYQRLLLMPQWKQKRKLILERDKNKCKNCGNPNYLEVHHRAYIFLNATQSFVAPWEYCHQYLITLCSTCHNSGHLHYKIPIIYK